MASFRFSDPNLSDTPSFNFGDENEPSPSDASSTNTRNRRPTRRVRLNRRNHASLTLGEAMDLMNASSSGEGKEASSSGEGKEDTDSGVRPTSSATITWNGTDSVVRPTSSATITQPPEITEDLQNMITEGMLTEEQALSMLGWNVSEAQPRNRSLPTSYEDAAASVAATFESTRTQEQVRLQRQQRQEEASEVGREAGRERREAIAARRNARRSVRVVWCENCQEYHTDNEESSGEESGRDSGNSDDNETPSSGSINVDRVMARAFQEAMQDYRSESSGRRRSASTDGSLNESFNQVEFEGLMNGMIQSLGGGGSGGGSRNNSHQRRTVVSTPTPSMPTPTTPTTMLDQIGWSNGLSQNDTTSRIGRCERNKGCFHYTSEACRGWRMLCRSSWSWSKSTCLTSCLRTARYASTCTKHANSTRTFLDSKFSWPWKIVVFILFCFLFFCTPISIQSTCDFVGGHQTNEMMNEIVVMVPVLHEDLIQEDEPVEDATLEANVHNKQSKLQKWKQEKKSRQLEFADDLDLEQDDEEEEEDEFEFKKKSSWWLDHVKSVQKKWKNIENQVQLDFEKSTADATQKEKQKILIRLAEIKKREVGELKKINKGINDDTNEENMQTHRLNVRVIQEKAQSDIDTVLKINQSETNYYTSVVRWVSWLWDSNWSYFMGWLIIMGCHTQYPYLTRVLCIFGVAYYCMLSLLSTDGDPTQSISVLVNFFVDAVVFFPSLFYDILLDHIVMIVNMAYSIGVLVAVNCYVGYVLLYDDDEKTIIPKKILTECISAEYILNKIVVYVLSDPETDISTFGILISSIYFIIRIVKEQLQHPSTQTIIMEARNRELNRNRPSNCQDWFDITPTSINPQLHSKFYLFVFSFALLLRGPQVFLLNSFNRYNSESSATSKSSVDSSYFDFDYLTQVHIDAIMSSNITNTNSSTNVLFSGMLIEHDCRIMHRIPGIPVQQDKSSCISRISDNINLFDAKTSNSLWLTPEDLFLVLDIDQNRYLSHGEMHAFSSMLQRIYLWSKEDTEFYINGHRSYSDFDPGQKHTITYKDWNLFWERLPRNEYREFLILIPKTLVLDTEHLHYMVQHLHQYVVPFSQINQIQVPKTMWTSLLSSTGPLICWLKNVFQTGVIVDSLCSIFILLLFGKRALPVYLLPKLISMLPYTDGFDEYFDSKTWLYNIIILCGVFSTEKLKSITSGIEFEISRYIRGLGPGTQFLQTLTAPTTSPMSNTSQFNNMMRNNSTNSQEGSMFVRCPLCREQTIRANAISNMITDSEVECCCCLDSPAKVGLTCGHICLCSVCFAKL